MPITGIYGGFLALLYVVLVTRVIMYRTSNKIPLGDGGDRTLLRRMRVQQNFAEHVPLALILMASTESIGGFPELTIHVMGQALLLGRLLHAIGMSREPDIMILRVIGMVLTLVVVIFAACTAVWGLLIR